MDTLSGARNTRNESEVKEGVPPRVSSGTVNVCITWWPMANEKNRKNLLFIQTEITHQQRTEGVQLPRTIDEATLHGCETRTIAKINELAKLNDFQR